MESWLQEHPNRVKQILPTYGNQATGKTRPCNVKDIVHEPPVELWNVDTMLGRAGKFINHPTNLPSIPLNTD